MKIEVYVENDYPCHCGFWISLPCELKKLINQMDSFFHSYEYQITTIKIQNVIQNADCNIFILNRVLMNLMNFNEKEQEQIFQNSFAAGELFSEYIIKNLDEYGE